MTKPTIAITMGDAAGIGPEIIVKALAHPEVYECCNPVVLGDAKVMEMGLHIAKSTLKLHKVKSPAKARGEYGIIDLIDYDNIDTTKLELGVVNPMNGDAAVFYTKKAGQMCLKDQVAAMVSAPLNKESMRAAGHNYEGQTQILGELCGAKKYSMILMLGKMRLMLVTTHMSLKEVCERLTKQRILDMIELAQQTLTFLGIDSPKIGVAALNPHAGEHGLFGDEEQKEIIPAIEAARARGINAIGPVPADTAFLKAKEGEFDLTLAMYHDQGMIVVKLLGFGQVVTLLAGLPLIRTSVGHGTAFDIAGKNLANHKNLVEAIRVAAELGTKRIQSLTERKASCQNSTS